MKLALIALAAFLSTPTPTPVADDIRIDVGRANWSEFPQLVPEPRGLPMGEMLVRMERMLRDRECVLAGQRHTRFDVTVPWLVQVEPDGRLSRVVIADMGCRALEIYVADLIINLAARGDIRPPAAPEQRVYASDFNFNLITSH
jgi:hypothetical protein